MITRTAPFRAHRAATMLSLILVSLVPAALHAQAMQAWLLVSADASETLISTDPSEKNRLVEGNWKVNGTANLQAHAIPGSVPLHRMARSRTGGTDRMLETDEKKLAVHAKEGFTDEGVMGYVASAAKPGLVPVHHFTRDDAHLWLVDAKQLPTSGSGEWKSAGVAFWMWPIAQPKVSTPAK